MNIWILWKSSMRKKNNLENILERNLSTDRAKECIFRASEGINLGNFFTGHQRWWLAGLMYVPLYPKKLWISFRIRYLYIWYDMIWYDMIYIYIYIYIYTLLSIKKCRNLSSKLSFLSLYNTHTHSYILKDQGLK